MPLFIIFVLLEDLSEIQIWGLWLELYRINGDYCIESIQYFVKKMFIKDFRIGFNGNIRKLLIYNEYLINKSVNHPR